MMPMLDWQMRFNIFMEHNVSRQTGGPPAFRISSLMVIQAGSDDMTDNSTGESILLAQGCMKVNQDYQCIQRLAV